MMDDDAIRALVKRLSRRHRSGGDVIERAAIMAAGDESVAILSWIAEHGGRPETVAPTPAAGGLHGRNGHGGGLHGGGLRGGSLAGGATGGGTAPSRYVLPHGATDAGVATAEPGSAAGDESS